MYIKTADGKTDVLEVVLTETVYEIKRKIRSRWTCADDDAYLTFVGKVLRGSGALRKCGVHDGNTVHVMEALRGGGTHTQKKSKGTADKVRDLNPEGLGQPQGDKGEVQVERGGAIQECDK